MKKYLSHPNNTYKSQVDNQQKCHKLNNFNTTMQTNFLIKRGEQKEISKKLNSENATKQRKHLIERGMRAV